MKVGKAGGKEALVRIMRNGNKKETRMKREKKGIFLKPKNSLPPLSENVKRKTKGYKKKVIGIGCIPFFSPPFSVDHLRVELTNKLSRGHFPPGSSLFPNALHQ